MRGDLLALGAAGILALGASTRRGSRALDDPDAWDDFVEANETFLYGRCVTLAIALHRFTGLPLYGVTAVDEDEDGNGHIVLLHAYVRRGKAIIDLRGARSYDDMLADFSHDDAFGNDMDESAMDEATLAKLATGRKRCPSLASAKPIAAAVWKYVQEGALRRGSRASLASRLEPAVPSGTPPPLPAWNEIERELRQIGFDREDAFENAAYYVREQHPDLPEAAVDARVWRNARQAWKDLQSVPALRRDPIRIWREVRLSTWSDLRLDDLGIFWSWDPDGAQSYNQGHGMRVLLVGEVSAAAVDWTSTLWANFNLVDEREITLREGAEVHLLRAVEADTGAVRRENMRGRA